MECPNGTQTPCWLRLCHWIYLKYCCQGDGLLSNKLCCSFECLVILPLLAGRPFVNIEICSCPVVIATDQTYVELLFSCIVAMAIVVNSSTPCFLFSLLSRSFLTDLCLCLHKHSSTLFKWNSVIFIWLFLIKTFFISYEFFIFKIIKKKFDNFLAHLHKKDFEKVTWIDYPTISFPQWPALSMFT